MSKLIKVKDLYSTICENGHLQTSILENPEDFDGNFCTICRGKILKACTCDAFIKGGYLAKDANPDFADICGPQYIENNEVPNYCHNCGKAYPWVEHFLEKYKTILELESENLNKELQDAVYNATEEAIKNKFTGSSLNILKLNLNKVVKPSKTIILSTLTDIASSNIINLLR